MQKDAVGDQTGVGLGIALMALAMLLIPVVDATAKWLSAEHSPWFLGWVRYAMASTLVVPIAGWVHGRALFPTRDLVSHGLRTVFLVIAMTLYFFAIARVPLSTAVTAYFVGPILSVGFAVIFLGERLTLTKAVSLAMGFGGAVIVLDPKGQVDLGILLALGSGMFFALYLVATRKTAQCDPPLKTLAFQCVLGTALLAPQAALNWSTPSMSEMLLFVVLGLVSAISHVLAISAFARAEASILAPLVYLELISALGLGWYVFGEAPAASVWIGGGMIALGGILLIRARKP
ncbi:MAG: DMT family transporter [Roseobacter sp.]